MKLLSSVTILKNVWHLIPRHLKEYAEPTVWMVTITVVLSILPTLGATAPLYFLIKLVSEVIFFWAAIRIVDTTWMLYEGRAPAESLTRTLSWGHVGRLIDFIITFLVYTIIVYASFYSLILAIPSIIFAFWFSFTVFAFLIEGAAPGTGALKRSSDLVQGRFWAVVWRWLVSLVPAAVVVCIIGAAVILGVNALSGDVGRVAYDHLWWNVLIRNLAAIVFFVWTMVTGTVLFSEVRKSL
ncbi:MAG: hypothetical protein V1821_03335 [bacterium]